jgi:hypothetical protein
MEGLKVCVRCEERKLLTDFYVRSTSKDGRDRYCKSCERARAGGKKRTNEKWYAWAEKRRVTHPHMFLFQSTRDNSKARGLEFCLEPTDLLVPSHCPVLGIPLFFIRGKKGPNTPSVDRIDNSKGYVKGNVVVVSWRANSLKSNATLSELRLLADYYINRSSERGIS